MPADVPLLQCSGSCLVPGDLPGPGATAAALWQVSCLLAVPLHTPCPRAWGDGAGSLQEDCRVRRLSSCVSHVDREGPSLLPGHQRAMATLVVPQVGAWAQLTHQRGLARSDVVEVSQMQVGSHGPGSPKAQCR